MRAVAAGLEALAEQRQVRLVCALPTTVLALHADPTQVRTALTCLVRNAVEAAPAEGWAAVRVEVIDEQTLELVVEDNGPGPGSADRDHLFDPFYSGRKAGRGRGLGLPTAWRLARQHGGDVRFVRGDAGPTRFVLRWPRAAWNPTPPAEPTANGVNGCHVSA
jgi:signal transduction histidine kinase